MISSHDTTSGLPLAGSSGFVLRSSLSSMFAVAGAVSGLGARVRLTLRPLLTDGTDAAMVSLANLSPTNLLSNADAPSRSRCRDTEVCMLTLKRK